MPGTYEIETFPTVEVYYSSAWVALECLTQPKLHIAENRGADISLGVPLTAWYAARCTPGVRLRAYVGTTSDLQFDGWITTAAKGTANELTVKAVDLLTMMGSMGATLYRNYYSSALSTASGIGGFDSSVPAFTLDLGSDNRVMSLDEVVYNANRSYSLSGSYIAYPFKKTTPFIFYYASHPFSYFRALTCTVFGDNSALVHAGSAKVVCNGTILASTSWGDQSDSNYTFTLDAGNSAIDVTGKTLIIYVYLGTGSTGTQDNIWVETSSSNDSDYMLYTKPVASTTTKVLHNRLSAHWYGYTAKKITSGYQSGNVLYLTGVEDTTIEQSAMWTNFDGGLTACDFTHRVEAVYTAGHISAAEVMSQIVAAAGYSFSNASGLTGAYITEFRAAGGNITDYLQKLAETNATGDRYFSIATNGGTVVVGARRTKADTATYAIVYGGDTQTAYTNLDVVSANPNMTSVRRHPVCVAKGTKTSNGDSSSSSPLIVACVDSSSLNSLGKALADVASDTSNSTNYACAATALSKVQSGRASEWSGTFTVAGIWRDLISRVAVTYGSGVPVRIYYSPLGLSDYAAKVREITIDWEAATTAITVNNYSMMYSNAISDSDTMALHAANYSVNSATDQSFTTQYVMVYPSTAQTILSSGNKVKVTLANNLYSTVDAEVFRFPELGTATIVAVFPSYDDFYDLTHAHSVTKVQVNSGTAITIDSDIRPDKRRSQTLIVNIITSI